MRGGGRHPLAVVGPRRAAAGDRGGPPGGSGEWGRGGDGGRGLLCRRRSPSLFSAGASVAAPFFLRAAISTFATLERDQLDAARDLGASEWTVFHRVALPLAADGLRAGWALAFARGAGEFGATLLFAGSVMRVTQTLPLAVYAQLGIDLDAAIAIGILLLALSALVLVISKLPPLWSPAAPSASGSGW